MRPRNEGNGCGVKKYLCLCAPSEDVNNSLDGLIFIDQVRFMYFIEPVQHYVVGNDSSF